MTKSRQKDKRKDKDNDDNLSESAKLFFNQDDDEIEFPTSNSQDENEMGDSNANNDDDDYDEPAASRKGRKVSKRHAQNDDDDEEEEEADEEEEDDGGFDEEENEEEEDEDAANEDEEDRASSNGNDKDDDDNDFDVAAPFKNFFEGFGCEVDEADQIKLKKEEYDIFFKNDYEQIALMVKDMNTATRLKLLDHLNEKEINILQIPKDSSQNFRIIYFGIFSPWHIFHALVLKCAFMSKNLQDFMYIFLLKDSSTIKEIKDSYSEIYHKMVDDEIELTFPSMSKYLKILLNSATYRDTIRQDNMLTEVAKTFQLVNGKDFEKILKYIVSLRPKSFKALAASFYSKYNYTLTEYLAQQTEDSSVLTFFRCLQMSLVSPVYFYCKILNEGYNSSVSNHMLPYIAFYLDGNGLKHVSQRYTKCFGNLDVDGIGLRYEDSVSPFLTNCLSKYFA